MNKVLVIGSGGREHAIIHQINQSQLVSQIFCIPGNYGISKIAQSISDIKINNHQDIIKFCLNKQIDLVIIGPEKPLIAGLSDDLRNSGIKVFGPSKLASQLEGSKIFTKKLCDQFQIPTAKYQNFNNQDQAITYLDKIDLPIVIKADGIAAGKGVIIAQNKEEAINAIQEMFAGKFGNSGKKIIIEEFLEGHEVSFFCICDGQKAKFFGSAGDHKKVGINETGPNTGGMGTYSPSPFIDTKLHKEIINKIIEPTMKGMAKMDASFSGFLFAGIILTKNGPKLLEFNTRLGDPEAQTILPRLDCDLLQLMLESSQNDLKSEIKFKDQKAVCVIIASTGYPGDYKKGGEIKNLAKAENVSEDIIIFHAATKKDGDKIIATGGRVLGVTALADSFAQARQNSYQAIKQIDWQDGFYRPDIALKVVE